MNHLNPDDFPDSAYAHELRGGLEHLEFDAPLEAEYRLEHLRGARSRLKICYTLNLLLSILFTVDQIRRAGAWNGVSLAHLGALIPCAIALVWLPWSVHYERLYFAAGRLLVPIFSTLIAIFVAISIAEGRGEQSAFLTVVLLGVFLFSGLLFRAALLTSVLALVGFAVAAALLSFAPALWLKCVATMILTSGIAATACHDAERSRRRRFLEGALIAQLVTRDGATGLVNRLAFDQYLPRVWRHALREKRSMALLVIDIDHFKKYNDDLGRAAGDAAICRVAQVVAGFARRPLDMAARHGGAQFAMILFDLKYPHAQHIAERIREEVQNLRIGQEMTVSVGVGVTTPSIGQAPDSVAQLAAEALYEAKQTGRNRVVVKGAEAYALLDTGRFGARSSNRL